MRCLSCLGKVECRQRSYHPHQNTCYCHHNYCLKYRHRKTHTVIKEAIITITAIPKYLFTYHLFFFGKELVPVSVPNIFWWAFYSDNQYIRYSRRRLAFFLVATCDVSQVSSLFSFSISILLEIILEVIKASI